MIEVILSHLLEIIIAIFLALISYAVTVLLDKLNIDKESALAAKINDGLHWGAQFAEGQLKERISKQGWDLEIENEFLAQAADYVAESYPQTMLKLGITPEHLAKMVKARLHEKLGASGSTSLKAN